MRGRAVRIRIWIYATLCKLYTDGLLQRHASRCTHARAVSGGLELEFDVVVGMQEDEDEDGDGDGEMRFTVRGLCGLRSAGSVASSCRDACRARTGPDRCTGMGKGGQSTEPDTNMWRLAVSMDGADMDMHGWQWQWLEQESRDPERGRQEDRGRAKSEVRKGAKRQERVRARACAPPPAFFATSCGVVSVGWRTGREGGMATAMRACAGRGSFVLSCASAFGGGGGQ